MPFAMTTTHDDDSAPDRAARPENAAAEGDRSCLPLVTTRKREAEEWALVLAAEGFTPQTRSGAAGWQVEIESRHRGEAEATLRAWQEERAERAAAAAAPSPHPEPPLGAGALVPAYALALTLLGFHVYVERTGLHAEFVRAGASRAALVLAGEPWRVITALSLHADAVHVAGNTLFGGFFLAAVSGRLGLGVGVLAFLVSGSVGNLANAVYYAQGHSSVGASTGVFGLVGVLSGLAAWRRHQIHRPRRGAWVAFGAGLGVVAMLGGPAPQVDFSAHLFGLAAGGATGVALAWPLATRPRPGPRVQFAALLLSALLVAGAWRLA